MYMLPLQVRELGATPVDLAGKLCDVRGNNILHRCVMKNKASHLPTIVAIQPSLINHVNKEEITPIEQAVKVSSRLS